MFQTVMADLVTLDITYNSIINIHLRRGLVDLIFTFDIVSYNLRSIKGKLV